MEKYFSKRLAGIGACKVLTIEKAAISDPMLFDKMKNDPLNRGLKAVMTPPILSELTKGNNILIIQLGMTYENGKEYTKCATFEKIEADGSFRMHISGKRLTGKMVEIPKEKESKGRQLEGHYEFVVTARGALPKPYVDKGARFFANQYTRGLVLKPFVYKTEGVPAPLPAD